MSFDLEKLIDKAIEGQSHAYTPYSHFNVGAAILLKNGEYVLGCNVENASYGLCNCAERTAMFKMISEGYTKSDVVAICVIGNTPDPISPCGACRQVMCELLNKDTVVILANNSRKTLETTVEKLLPYSFDGEVL